jgi:hypothetical protein
MKCCTKIDHTGHLYKIKAPFSLSSSLNLINWTYKLNDFIVDAYFTVKVGCPFS